MRISLTQSPRPSKYKADPYTKAAPDQNTWYTTFQKTNVEVRQVLFEVGTTGEDLEVKVTIDDESATASQAAGAGTDYSIFLASTLAADLTANATGNYCLFGSPSGTTGTGTPVPCRSIKIEIRKTSANGAGTLKVVVNYGQF